MAPMKRQSKSLKTKKGDPIKSRCKEVKDAIQDAENVSDKVKEMLCSTIPVTIGAFKPSRHPFNDRFVAMISEVLVGEEARMVNDLAAKDAAFAELTPAKATREAALEAAKADAVAKGEALDSTKQAVSDAAAAVKEAGNALKEAAKALKVEDDALEAISAKKAKLEDTVKDALAPLLDGTATTDKTKKAKAVLDCGKTWGFDASLLATAEPVLQKEVADRGSFDATCIEQLQAAFAGAVALLDEQLAAGAGGRAEKAAAVAAKEAAKQAAEASQADLKQQQQAAKEAKAAANAAENAASQSLDDFMPDLKASGDALDDAKVDLKDFREGPMQSFQDLKDHKEGDFPPAPGASYYETIDGMKTDRGIIDACRTSVEGKGDGRVSVDDARRVFEAVADGGKETQCERWTVRYCLQEFKWTEAAHDWLVAELKSVHQEGITSSPAKKARTAGYYKTIDGYKCDSGIIDACSEAIAGQGDGRVSEEDAKKVWEKVADGNKVTEAEKWTVRYCLSNFVWTRGAHDWMLTQLRNA